MQPLDAKTGLTHLLNKHSRRVTLWGDSSMHLDFQAIANEALGPVEEGQYYWCYYTHQQASDLFDRIMATGLVTYYAAPKEEFSQIQGFRNAAKAGHSFVILEDMS